MNNKSSNKQKIKSKNVLSQTPKSNDALIHINSFSEQRICVLRISKKLSHLETIHIIFNYYSTLARFCLFQNISKLKPQGGSEGQKLSNQVILKDLIEIKKMLKSASKNIIPSPSYDFFKSRFACNYNQYAKNVKSRCPKTLLCTLLRKPPRKNLVYMFLWWVSTKVTQGLVCNFGKKNLILTSLLQKPTKEHINQVSGLFPGWFSREGT